MPSVPNSPGTCPIDIDETVEAYVMKRLSPADALQFAIHRLTCRPCAAAAEEAERFVRAMKVAARRLSTGPRDRPRLCSRASLTSVTSLSLGSVRVRMRFDVTVCEAPRTRRCLTHFEIR